jgi:hypothetical protein
MLESWEGCSALGCLLGDRVSMRVAVVVGELHPEDTRLSSKVTSLGK